MFLLHPTYSGYTPLEKYFIESAYEMVHRHTIDSYKVKFTNPLLILEELLEVLIGLEKGQIKRFETVDHVRQEAIRRLKEEDQTINYAGLTKEFVLENLKLANEKDFQLAKTSLQLLVENSKTSYRPQLLQQIEKHLQNPSTDKAAFLTTIEKVEKPIQFLFTDLIRSGFSKFFLSKLIYSKFIADGSKTFEQRFLEFKAICLRNQKSFDVIFKCQMSPAITKSGANLFIYFDRISGQQYHQLKASQNKVVSDFFKDGNTFFRKNIFAFDRYSAVMIAKPWMAKFLDLLHLGFDQKAPVIDQKVLLTNIQDPNGKAELSSVSFQLEGFFRSGKELFESLFKKVSKIDQSDWIPGDTKKRIKSAIRYLRLGSQAIEEEHRFLNYWIGLEYLFSNYSGESTFQRIKRYLIPIHTNVYVPRNLLTFHQDLIELKCHEQCAIIQENSINYLFEEANWTTIEDTFWQGKPLVAARASRLRKALFSNSERKKYINKQITTLNQHLSRLYRVRNEIVHDAAIDGNLMILISSLRYYLVFILSGLIESLVKSDSNSGESSIESYLIRNQLKSEFLKAKGHEIALFKDWVDQLDSSEIYALTYLNRNRS